MRTCKYCGKSTGLFSNKHAECEDKHNEGLASLSRSIDDYFGSKIAFAVLKSKIETLRIQNFVTDADVVAATQASLQALSSTLKRQNAANLYQHIKEFVTNIGVRYDALNSTHILDTFGEKFVRYHLVSYFAAGTPIQKVKQLAERIAHEFHLTSQQVEHTHMDVLDKAAENFLKDGIITDNEQRQVDEYVQCFGVPINQLSSQYQNSQIEKLAQAAVLKDIQRGSVPANPLPVPVILGRNESALWIYGNVTYYQEKVEKEFVGRHGGFSFKVMKGVYYRTGQSRGKPVEHSYMDKVGVGQLIITNQNIIFYSQAKSVKIPFKKIVGLVPYSDGIEVQKDGATSKRIVFQGLDCWFIMNLLSQISI